jgi:predicted GNAT family N-acyltransferase
VTASTRSHEFTIRILSWKEAQSLARPVREAVFVHEQGVPFEEEWDEWDASAGHAVATVPDGSPVGTGRLLFGAQGEGRIGRMAVLRSWRGRGVGAALLAGLVELAMHKGMTTIVLNAQVHALDFYRRYGFVAEGTEFFEAGIAHFSMRRTLIRDSD